MSLIPLSSANDQVVEVTERSISPDMIQPSHPSSINSPVAGQPFKLLSLPREIRRIIFKILFKNSHMTRHIWGTNIFIAYQSVTLTGGVEELEQVCCYHVLLTCKQLYHEGYPVFLASTFARLTWLAANIPPLPQIYSRILLLEYCDASFFYGGRNGDGDVWNTFRGYQVEEYIKEISQFPGLKVLQICEAGLIDMRNFDKYPSDEEIWDNLENGKSRIGKLNKWNKMKMDFFGKLVKARPGLIFLNRMDIQGNGWRKVVKLRFRGEEREILWNLKPLDYHEASEKRSRYMSYCMNKERKEHVWEVRTKCAELLNAL